MISDEISTFLDSVYIKPVKEKTITQIQNKWPELELYHYVDCPSKIQKGYYIRLIDLNLEKMSPVGIVINIIYNNKVIKHVLVKRGKKTLKIIPGKYYIFQLKPDKSSSFARKVREIAANFI